MKSYTLLLFLLVQLSFQATGQFISSKLITQDAKIVGWSSRHDSLHTYKEYNFILKDKKAIDSFIQGFFLGEEGRIIYERKKGFNIRLIVNKEETKYWSISPRFNTIHDNGKGYAFDMNFIQSFSKNHWFDYWHYTKEFTTMKDYQKYLTELKKLDKFLFSYEPSFKYEGSFNICYNMDTIDNAPGKYMYLLEKEYATKVNPKEFLMHSMSPEKDNPTRSKYITTIETSKANYEKLKSILPKNAQWEYNEAIAYFFFEK